MVEMVDQCLVHRNTRQRLINTQFWWVNGVHYVDRQYALTRRALRRLGKLPSRSYSWAVGFYVYDLWIKARGKGNTHLSSVRSVSYLSSRSSYVLIQGVNLVIRITPQGSSFYLRSHIYVWIGINGHSFFSKIINMFSVL